MTAEDALFEIMKNTLWAAGESNVRSYARAIAAAGYSAECTGILRELIDALPASLPGKKEGPLLMRARVALARAGQ